MLSRIVKSLLAGSVAASGLVWAGAASAEDMVALLLPENVNPRWEQQDAAAFVRTMGQMPTTTHPRSSVKPNRH